MTLEEREKWLQCRETVTMKYEDPLFLRELERCYMEQQDVVEMSRYTWEDLEPEEAQSFTEYQQAWRILGGGPIVLSRLQASGAPPTASERPSRVAAEAAK